MRSNSNTTRSVYGALPARDIQSFKKKRELQFVNNVKSEPTKNKKREIEPTENRHQNILGQVISFEELIDKMEYLDFRNDFESCDFESCDLESWDSSDEELDEPKKTKELDEPKKTEKLVGSIVGSIKMEELVESIKMEELVGSIKMEEHLPNNIELFDIVCNSIISQISKTNKTQNHVPSGKPSEQIYGMLICKDLKTGNIVEFYKPMFIRTIEEEIIMYNRYKDDRFVFGFHILNENYSQLMKNPKFLPIAILIDKKYQPNPFNSDLNDTSSKNLMLEHEWCHKQFKFFSNEFNQQTRMKNSNSPPIRKILETLLNHK